VIEVVKSATFDRWLRNLKDRHAKARIQVRIDRLALGNPGDVEPVGAGVSELRIHVGPGYRVSFITESTRIIVLLRGGDKSTQRADIDRAHRLAGRMENPMTPATENFSRYDTADYLDDTDQAAAYLAAAIEQAHEDPALIPVALGAIARSGNLSELARRVGMSREGLYKAFAEDGNPSFATVMKVAATLGLRISLEPAA